MATIVLQAAGAALGSVFGPVGTILGRAAGALAGAAIDRALLTDRPGTAGSPLIGARIPGAEEGTAITRLYGTMRIGGTLIWATRFEESVQTSARAARRAGRVSKPSAMPPIWPSESAKGRSPGYGGSGRMGGSSI